MAAFGAILSQKSFLFSTRLPIVTPLRLASLLRCRGVRGPFKACSKTQVDRIGQDSHFLASYHISLTYHLQVLLLSGLGRCAQPIKDIFWSQMGSTTYQKRKFHDSLFYCTYLYLLPWVTFLVEDVLERVSFDGVGRHGKHTKLVGFNCKCKRCIIVSKNHLAGPASIDSIRCACDKGCFVAQ